MLATCKHFELPANGLPRPIDVKTWRQISLQLRIPYFLVSESIDEITHIDSQASIMCFEEDMLDLCKWVRSTASRKVTQIALIMPLGPGKPHAWRFETVKEIWRGQVDADGFPVTVYFTATGERILGIFPASADQVSLLELVYSAAGMEALNNSVNVEDDLSHVAASFAGVRPPKRGKSY